MEHIDPNDWKATEGYRLALKDAESHSWIDDDACGQYSIFGYCCRQRGHTDQDVWKHNKHISYDSDHYEDWEVGWVEAQKHCPNCGFNLEDRD